MLRLHGEEVIPLSKLVKEFCLKQGNMKEANVFQQLVYAREIWKELFRKCIWGIRNVVLTVDCERNTIERPIDCERIINISVIDHRGKLQPLSCDPGISTVEIECIKVNCSCNNCNGQGTLCGAAEAGVSYTTEVVTIQGNPYNLETWTRYSQGAIQQEQKVPSLQAGTSNVVYNTVFSTLCNIETTDKGCIKPTNTNMELLRDYCGCGNFPESQSGISRDWYRGYENLIPQQYNYYGYWNQNAADASIIHIFRHDSNHHDRHNRNRIEKVVVSYQTNGEDPGAEILIPQFAKFAIDMGIMWYQKVYNPRATETEKEGTLNRWRMAKLNVNKHLNPIRMEDIEKLQTQARRW